MKTFLTIATLLLLQTPVSAKPWIHWREIAVGDDGTYTYVDPESVIREGDRFGFNILEVRSRPNQHNVLSSGGWYQVDCRKQRVEIISLRLLAPDNSTIRDYPKYRKIFPVQAGTNLEQIYRYGCSTRSNQVSGSTH